MYCGPNVREVESDGLYYSYLLSRVGSVCTVCPCSGRRVCWSVLLCTLISFPEPVPCVPCAHVEEESVGVPFLSKAGSVLTVCPCSGSKVWWSVLYCTLVSFPEPVPC